MGKSTRKEIEGTLRNTIAKQYTHTIEHLKSLLNERNTELSDIRKENNKLKQENFELADKIAQYEDWINRLQDFCNLSDEDREKEIQRMREKQSNEKFITHLTGFYGRFLSML